MAKKSKVKKQSYDQMMASSSKATSYEGMMANKDRYSQKNNLSVIGNAIDNMKRQRQQAESDSRTKAWQQATANMRYSPNGDQSWQAYAAKMISDTPGALDRIRQREQQATENRTKAWQDYARNATYAGQPEMAYGHKAILDTPIRESNRKIYGSEEQAKRTELSQFLYGLAQKRKEKETPKQTLAETKSVQGYETWRENNLPAEEQKKNKTALKPYLEYLGDTYKGIQAGRFDSEDDYRGWSDKKLAAEIQKKQNESQVKQAAAEEQLRQRIAEQPGEIFGSLFADDPDRGWITDQASGYFTNEMPGLFNDEDTPEDKRRITYDRILQEEDAYDTRTADMTPEEKAAFDETLDRAIQRAENPTAEDIEYHGWTPESGEAFHEARTDDELMKKYQGVYDARQKVNEMMAAAPEGNFESEALKPVKPQGNNVLQKWFSMIPQKQIKDKADKAYWEIIKQQGDFYQMSTAEKRDYLNKMGITTAGGGGLADSLQDTVNAQGAYYAFMTPEMVDTFNRYYESGDKESAMAFLSAVEGTGYLQACAAGYREWVADANARGDYGTLYGLATVPDQLLTGVAGMIGTAGAMFGDKELADPNNALWSHQSDIQTTRQARGDVIADTAANAYKNVQKWILSNLGGDAGRAVANSDTMLSHFSDWVKDPAKFLTNVSYSILDNMAAMGVGKFFGGNNIDSVMRTVQWIMSSEATSNTMMQKLKDGYSPTEAAVYAFGDGIIEAITEKYSLEALLKPDVKGMLGNGKELSKFLFKQWLAEGSEEVASDLMNQGLDYVLSVLNGHKNEIEIEIKKLTDKGVDEKDAIRQVWMQKLEQYGQSFMAGATSGLVMGAGRVGLNQISNKVTGQSIRNNKIEYNGKHGINAILDMAMNMPEGSNSAERAAKLIEQVNNGVEVSDREIGKLATLMQAEAAETIEKANSGEEVAQEDIDKSMRTLRSVAAIVENRVEEIEKPSKETTGLQLASPADIEEAERNGSQRTGSRMEVIYDGKFANLDKAEAVEGKDGGLMFRLEGMEEPVSADQIQATDFQTAAIIRQASQNQGFYSSKYTNRLLQAQRDGRIRNVSTFLNDAMLIRLSGYTGMQMPQHSMNQTLANELRMDAMEEHAENRKKQLEGANRQTEGRVTYKGAEYGSEEWSAAVKSLDKNMRSQMDAIAAVAQRAGIEVTFMDLAETEQGVRAQGLKDDPRGVYGWENRGGISVNVEGLDYGTLGEATGRHNMAVTFGHEMTHWLQRNSLKGYNRLEQYVMNDYAQRNGAMRLMANLNRYMNDGLNLEDAMSEMVANSCDQILGDEKVAEHIQNTDKSLYNEIKGFVQDLVNRVKTAITGMESSASAESKALLRTANRLAEVWLGAYDEAISGAISEGTGAEEDITRMSKAQLDRAYLQAVKEGDMETAQRMLREYKGGHTEFPVAEDVVRDFVAEKKNGRKGISRSGNGKIQLAGAEIEKSRFSRWTEESMDVNAWLAGATESTFQTEDERVMWQAWKDLRMKIQLSLKRQLMYQDQIRALEKKTELTKEERDQLTALQNKLEVQRNKMARLEDDLQQVTSSEGYAGMMYRNNVVLGDYITGKTQDQVRDTVEQMVKEVQKARGEIAKQAEELKKLAQSQAVKSMQSFFGKTSLKKMAYLMKKNYGSTMQNREIEARLAEMAMKQASGMDITDDCAELAQDLVDKIRGIRSEAMEQLRGMTFVIGENLAKELKAENTSLQELRRKLKGSGVKFVTNTKNQDGVVVDKHSRIAEQWEELRAQNQGLPDVSGMSEIEKLHTIADFIENEMARSRGAEQFGIDMDEAALFVRSAVGNVTTYLVDNPAARRQIENLMRQIQDLSGKTGKIAVNMDELSRKMEEVENAGIRARGWTTVLQRDVKDAINYYNKMAGVAARQEKQKVKEMIIDQLKGENTKKLIAQQEKYEKLMKDSEKARNLAQDNMTLRGKIQTVATRMGQRLFAETDTKNIPEEAKPLARFVLGMLEKHDDAFRHILLKDKKTRVDVLQRLMKMDAVYGPVDIDNDLNWLIVNPGPDQDTSVKEAVEKALQDIEMGMMEYRNAEGQGTVSLMDRKAALEKVQEAISKIWSVIRARSEMDINGRKWQVMEVAMMMDEGMRSSKYKGERFGFGSKARNAVTSALNYGNLTPEYFIKNLKNAGLNLLKKGIDSAEQRWGLNMARAKTRIAQIAEETGYKTWDGKEKHQVQVNGNRTVEMTTEQIMSLYATWKRESNALRPEETAHLLHGGFVLTQEDDSRKPRRARVEQRPIRITKDCLNGLRNYLTDQQAEYVDQIVAYMSGELAEIGNEASMQMYGIKKFTERFYFPIKSWGGVLNQKSDAGVKSNSENRAAQQGFSKRVRSNAANAIEIGDFTATAMNHIAGMINYNTIAPAVENMNKVLNQQYTEGEKTETEDERFNRNMRARFQEYYGKQAYDYLAQYMQDLNGGLARRKEVLLREKLLSLFKKNAVAGSLSVAAQQPLSYIRAAEMISPKYLAAAISPQYWKGSYKEMMEHSGLAVIKEMGKFDMDYGRTAVDYITPEGMQNKAKAAWNKTTDIINILPQKMDAMTWTRMWTACKLEQMAEHKDMDHKSDEFMELVAERFNELMRRTQVYDSVTVKSQNMRSDNYLKKVTTSFMAEPTLTLNVLADAWQNRKDKGGMKHAIKSLVLFALSAAAQAGAKAFFGAGRSPDKKKNQEENFLNKYGYNILSEANPLSLIPGYSQMMDVLMNGELNDDAMGVIGKAKEAFDNIKAMMTGDKKVTYRNLENGVGQLIQFATAVPAKNFMRDFRAMVNWFSGGKAVDFTGDNYANRATSGSVLKYQLLDTWMSDDLIGLINKELGEAGYGMDTKDYVQRLYEADKTGQKQSAKELREYLTLAKSESKDPEGQINEALRGLVKKDESLTTEQKYDLQKEYGLKKGGSFIMDEYKAGRLNRKDAERLYRKENPKAKDKDVLEALDKVEWEKAGNDGTDYSNYTPLYSAITDNKSDEIKKAVKYMTDNGYKQADIKEQLRKKYRESYMAAKGYDRTRLEDALTKAYKAIGLTAEEALKIIHGWTKEEKKEGKPSSSGGRIASAGGMSFSGNQGMKLMEQNMYANTEGELYGKGNIDLNHRKTVRNDDGSISTELSMSFYDEDSGKEVLIPTVVNGRIVSEEEAIDHYYETGEYLGRFNTPEEADAYAEMLHNRQDWYYNEYRNR